MSTNGNGKVTARERMKAILASQKGRAKGDPWALSELQEQVVRVLFAHGGPLHYRQVGCCLLELGWEPKTSATSDPFATVSSAFTTQIHQSAKREETAEDGTTREVKYREENPRPVWKWLLRPDSSKVAGTFELTPEGKKVAEKLAQQGDAKAVKVGLAFHDDARRAQA